MYGFVGNNSNNLWDILGLRNYKPKPGKPGNLYENYDDFDEFVLKNEGKECDGEPSKLLDFNVSIFTPGTILTNFVDGHAHAWVSLHASFSFDNLPDIGPQIRWGSCGRTNHVQKLMPGILERGGMPISDDQFSFNFRGNNAQLLHARMSWLSCECQKNGVRRYIRYEILWQGGLHGDRDLVDDLLSIIVPGQFWYWWSNPGGYDYIKN